MQESDLIDLIGEGAVLTGDALQNSNQVHDRVKGRENFGSFVLTYFNSSHNLHYTDFIQVLGIGLSEDRLPHGNVRSVFVRDYLGEGKYGRLYAVPVKDVISCQRIDVQR